MAANQGPKSKLSPLMIGGILGFGLVILFFVNLSGSSETAEDEPHPWRLLTINNVATRRNDLPTRVICQLPESAGQPELPVVDCYLRLSMQYNPRVDSDADTTSSPDHDCQLDRGFASLVFGVDPNVNVIDSQPVALADDCNLKPGTVVETQLWFRSVAKSGLDSSAPDSEQLKSIRFGGIDPQVDLTEKLQFVVANP